MKVEVLKAKRRAKRKAHVRAKINGTLERPRLTVFRSLNEFYAQLIDDVDGKTLVSASTIDKDLRGQITKDMNKTAKCIFVGKALAKKAIEANINKVSFDRNGYIYHGRIKAFADAVRQGGIEF